MGTSSRRIPTRRLPGSTSRPLAPSSPCSRKSRPSTSTVRLAAPTSRTPTATKRRARDTQAYAAVPAIATDSATSLHRWRRAQICHSLTSREGTSVIWRISGKACESSERDRKGNSLRSFSLPSKLKKVPSIHLSVNFFLLSCKRGTHFKDFWLDFSSEQPVLGRDSVSYLVFVAAAGVIWTRVQTLFEHSMKD